MENFHFELTDMSSISEVLDYLENESEYAETVQDNLEFAEGIAYAVNQIRSWVDEKKEETFVDVDFTKRNREFVGSRLENDYIKTNNKN
jgi:serine protease inhibitor